MMMFRSLFLNRILQSNSFKKKYIKLQRNVKDALNDAIKTIQKEPTIGEDKKGDLLGIKIYKFKFQTLLLLLAYRILNNDTIYLEAFGPHENFYRDLKK